MDLTASTPSKKAEETELSNAISSSGQRMCRTIDGASQRMAQAMVRSSEVLAAATASTAATAHKTAAPENVIDVESLKKDIITEVKSEMTSHFATFTAQLQRLLTREGGEGEPKQATPSNLGDNR